MKKYSLIVLAAIMLLAPAAVFGVANQVKSNVWTPTILAGPLVVCTGDGSGGFPACQSLCDLVAQVANVIYFFIGVVIWVIAPIMIAWSGLSFILSRGSTDKTSGARKMATGTAVGLLIVICAYLIVYTFVNVLNISGVGGFGNVACVVQ